MRALVAGQGSIGRRHARVLTGLGLDVAVVSRQREVLAHRTFAHIAQGLALHEPEYVVLATPTGDHLAGLAQLASAGFVGSVLVEKPVLMTSSGLPENRFAAIHVGYNLRFHPCIQRARQDLAAGGLSAVASVGQHLSTWRPGRNHRDGYSALKARGGGVLRDLSHELDYLLALFGPWRRVVASGGRLSDVTVDSEDCVDVLLEMERCPAVNLHLDYLAQEPRRQLSVHHAGGTFSCTLAGPGDEVHDPDQTYRAMHEDALGRTSTGALCKVEEGLEVVRLVEAIERSLERRAWVERA